jgi:hypothetical protein
MDWYKQSKAQLGSEGERRDKRKDKDLGPFSGLAGSSNFVCHSEAKLRNLLFGPLLHLQEGVPAQTTSRFLASLGMTTQKEY